MVICAHARFAKFIRYIFSNILWIWTRKLCGSQVYTFCKFIKTNYVGSNRTVNYFNKLIDLMNSKSNELEQWKNLEKVREKYPKAPINVKSIIATIILHLMLCLGEITLLKLKDSTQLIHSYRIILWNRQWSRHHTE